MIWRYILVFVYKRSVRRLILVFILLCAITNFYRLLLWSSQVRHNKPDWLPQSINLGLSQNLKLSDRLRWIEDYSVFYLNDGKNSNSSTRLDKKFLFSFRHYEQLGKATENLLALCSLAVYGNREVVAPFVNNSRMAGTPYGVSHRLRKKRNKKFAPFDIYFNFHQVNHRLSRNGYSTLTTFDDMARSCNYEVNVAVHFLYHDKKSIADTIYWFQIKSKDAREIYFNAKQNKGWTNCPQIRNSDLGEQLGGFKIDRYVCVDPEVVRDPEIFENDVLQNAKCVGVVQWKGRGVNRAHFSLATSISNQLHHWDLQHNQQLVNIANTFVEASGLGRHFISVHVRAERHIFRRGLNVTQQCFQKVATRLQKLQSRHDKWKVYLASDLVDHGSDTLIQELSKKQRLLMYRDLNKILNYPITLNAIDGLYDTGAIAIIEMHILAAGKKLVTLGGGNYQEWLVKLFTHNVHDTTHSLFRICEIRS